VIQFEQVILYIVLGILEGSVGDESANRFDEADLVGGNLLALTVIVLNGHSLIENRCDCDANIRVVNRIDLWERGDNGLRHNVDFDFVTMHSVLVDEGVFNVGSSDDEFHVIMI